MIGQHHPLNGPQFAQTLGDGGQSANVLQSMESQRVGLSH